MKITGPASTEKRAYKVKSAIIKGYEYIRTYYKMVDGKPERCDEGDDSALTIISIRKQGQEKGSKSFIFSEGYIGAENPFAFQRSVVRPRLAVKPLSGQLCRQVQGGGAGGKPDGVFAAHIFTDGFLHLIDIPADSGNPVGQDRFVHPALLVSVHGGGGKPDPGRKWLYAVKTGIRFDVDHTLLLQRLITVRDRNRSGSETGPAIRKS